MRVCGVEDWMQHFSTKGLLGTFVLKPSGGHDLEKLAAHEDARCNFSPAGPSNEGHIYFPSSLSSYSSSSFFYDSFLSTSSSSLLSYPLLSLAFLSTSLPYLAVSLHFLLFLLRSSTLSFSPPLYLALPLFVPYFSSLQTPSASSPHVPLYCHPPAVLVSFRS